jgi:hypothetical protein
MKCRIPASTVLALGVLAGGLLAVAAVQAAQYGGNLTQERLMTQQRTQNQLRSDQLSNEALQWERLMNQQRIQSQQMLRGGAGPSGSVYQHQFQNQQRQQLQFQPQWSQGAGMPGGSGSGARMGTGGGRR